MIATKERSKSIEPETIEPTKSAVQLYRESVFSFSDSGEMPDDSVLIDAGRTRADFRADFAVYGARLNAVHDLNVRVPELEVQLLEAERAAAAVADIAKVKIASLTTVADLVSALVEFGRWQDSLPSLDLARPRPTCKLQEQVECRQIESSIASVRGRAEQVLSTTAAVDPQLETLCAERAALNRELASRNPADLSGLIEAKKSEVLLLVQRPAVDSRKSHRQQLSDSRAELAALEAKARSATPREGQGEEKRLAEIAEKISALEARRFDPKCMRWS